jgi:hypothetical protein
MSIVHKQTLSLAVDGGSSVSGTATEVGSTNVSIDQVFAAGTNVLFTITFAHATLQSVILVSDQDMTVKTNSSGSPDDTISLKANNPLVWSASAAYYTNPFSHADVTKFYLTNATAARLKGRFLNT